MNNVTDTMNEQFKQVMDAQSKAFEPMKSFASVATDALEQLARKNYAVMGDVLEFSTKQARLPLTLTGENMTEVGSTQTEEAKAFAELMNGRATEYADMAQQFSSKVQEVSEKSIPASFK